MDKKKVFLPEFSEDDVNRLCSLVANDAQVKFDLATLSVYHEMGLIADIDLDNQTPDTIADKIAEIQLNDEQKAEYDLKFVEKVINEPDLFQLVPPHILTNAYIKMRDLKKKSPDDKVLLKNFDTVENQIDTLIGNFDKYYDYYIAVASNIADVYRGYNKMCNARRETLGANYTGNRHSYNISKSIDNVQSRLAKIIKEYEELWNLSKVSSKDSKELDKRWLELSKKLKDIEINDDLLKTLSEYVFLDENNNVLPQFVDDKGNPHADFKPGYKLNPESRLAHIISLAKNDVAMQNVGNLDTAVKDMNLTESVNERVPSKMAEIGAIVQAVRDAKIKAEENSNTDKEEAKEEKVISDDEYQSVLDADANKTAEFVGALSEKTGKDAPVLEKPLQVIEDIDKSATTPTEKAGAKSRKEKIGFFKRMLKNFGMAATVSAGLTFLGKATGVAAIGAAIGTSIGIANMAYQGMKWRREQKKQNKPFGIKEFFADKRNWGPAVASGLGVAATISMATGNPMLAASFGVGAMAVGGGSSAVMLYQDAVNAGYSRGTAVAGALGVVGATVVGALTGRVAMDGVVNYVNDNTDSTLFKIETTKTIQTETIERGYADGVIEHNEHILQQWENPQQYAARINGLMNAGLSHDDAVRYLLAWHDATDHNLGNGYFKSIGLDAETLNALRSSINGNEINISQQSLSAFEQFNPHISTINQVGYVAGAPISHNLPANAQYGANGDYVPGKDFYSTYVNHNENVFTYNHIVNTDVKPVFVPNVLSYPAGMGMFGIYEPRVQNVADDVKPEQKPVAEKPKPAETPKPVNKPQESQPSKFKASAHYVFETFQDFGSKIKDKFNGWFTKSESKPVEQKPVVEKTKPIVEVKPVEKPADTTKKSQPSKFKASAHYVFETFQDFGSKIKDKFNGWFTKSETKPVEQKPVAEKPKPVVEVKPVEKPADTTKKSQPSKFKASAHYVLETVQDFGSKIKDKFNGWFTKSESKPVEQKPVVEKPKPAETPKPVVEKPAEVEETPQKPSKFVAHVHYVMDTFWDWRDHWNKRKIEQQKIEIEKQKNEIEKNRLETKLKTEKIKQKEKIKQEQHKTRINEEKRKKQMQIEEITKQNAAKLAEKKGKLARERAEALAVIQKEKDAYAGELSKDSIRSSMECETRIARLATLKREVTEWREMGGAKAVEDLKEMQQVQIDLDLMREQGKQDVAAASIRGNTNRVREFGRRIAAFFKGTKDVTEEQIEAEKRALELAELKQKRAIVEGKTVATKQAISQMEYYVRGGATNDKESKKMSNIMMEFYKTLNPGNDGR